MIDTLSVITLFLAATSPSMAFAIDASHSMTNVLLGISCALISGIKPRCIIESPRRHRQRQGELRHELFRVDISHCLAFAKIFSSTLIMLLPQCHHQFVVPNVRYFLFLETAINQIYSRAIPA